MSDERYLIEREDVSEFRVWRITKWTHTKDLNMAPRLTEREADLMRDALKDDEILWRESEVLAGTAGELMTVVHKGDRHRG